MVEVAGKPILHHQIIWLRKQGIRNVIFLTGYMADAIQDYFVDGERFNMSFQYSHEDTPLGRGGAVKQGLSLLPDDVENFVVMNGDNIPNFSLYMMRNLHLSTGAAATLALVPYTTQYGVVTTSGIMVDKFREKGQIPGLFINAGIYLFNKRIKRLLPNNGDHETTTFPHLAEQMSLAAYPLPPNATWYTMDTIADVERVSRELERGD